MILFCWYYLTISNKMCRQECLPHKWLSGLDSHLPKNPHVVVTNKTTVTNFSIPFMKLSDGFQDEYSWFLAGKDGATAHESSKPQRIPWYTCWEAMMSSNSVYKRNKLRALNHCCMLRFSIWFGTSRLCETAF